MLSSGVLLPGNNTEIQAGGVKKSIFFFSQQVDEQNRKAESKQRAC